MSEAGVHRLADRVFRPWRNGGGETAEILASPPGAGFEDFVWRISTAIVATSGPFSVFAGVDRVLTVLEGGAMVLSMPGGDRRVDAASAPLAFPGDVAVSARLEGEALLDFNVMVRRPFRARVMRGTLDPGMGGAREHLALLLADGAGLGRFDLVDLRAAAPARVAALAGSTVLDVRIFG